MSEEDIKDFINNNFFQLTILAIVVTTCFMTLIIIDKIEDNYYQVELEGNNE